MVQLTKNQLHTVTITGYTAEGLGVARTPGGRGYYYTTPGWGGCVRSAS